MAHKKYGKLPWKELVTPSIELAQNGFPLTWALWNESENWRSNNQSTDYLKTYFLDDKDDPVAYGGLWKQPELAQTLKKIAADGHDGFYKGPVAEEIASYIQKNDGIITVEDLAKYKAVERPAITSTFNGFTIYSMPPPSSGGVTMAAMLNILEQADLKSIPFNSTAYTHLMIESMRRGFADRAEYLGDPDFNINMPIDSLLSKERAKSRFENIDRSRAFVECTRRVWTSL